MSQDDHEHFGSAEFAALRSIAESARATSTMIAAQTTELRSLAKKMDDVQERVIRLEAQRHGQDIEVLTEAKAALERRIAALELSHAAMTGQIQGANTLASLVRTYFPVLAVAVAAFFYLTGFTIEKKP